MRHSVIFCLHIVLVIMAKFGWVSHLNNTSLICAQVEISKVYLALSVQGGGENNPAPSQLRQAQILLWAEKLSATNTR